MVTIKLTKKPGAAPADAAAGPRRAPVRGNNAHRNRTTLAEAQAQRAARDIAPPSGFGELSPRDDRHRVRLEPPLERPHSTLPAARAVEPRPRPPPPPLARPVPVPRQIPPEALRLRALLHDDEDIGPGHPRRPVDNSELPRLSKRMSELGLASRREADEWISAGWVSVDGVVIDQLGARVRPEQKIEVDPMARQQQAQRVTILIHKPIGWVSGQPEDGYESAASLIRGETHWARDGSGLRFHHGHLRHLAPAGRLDIDSTGLLVLTQDGRVAKQLIGADSEIEKEYLVRVSWLARPDLLDLMHNVPAELLDRLRFGLELDGQRLKPARVSWQNEQQLRFVLREGKKRQIRRMCEQVGLKVIGLKRVRIGRVTLGDMPLGEWRYLTQWEKF